jgi:predicted Zn-dependent peptidase
MGVGLLSDIFWAPAFRPDEFDAERQVILEEILMHADEPAELVHEILNEAMFPGHPLGREVLGEQATVSAMSTRRIRSFHSRHYRPVNLVVAAAGRLEHDRIVSGINSRVPPGIGGSKPRRKPPKGARGARTVLARPTEQCHIAVGFPGPSRSDEDRHAMSVFEHVLGGGMSSRLFQTIREQRGLAYSVYSYRSSFEQAGTISVYAGTSPSNAAQVLRLIEQEIETMAAEGISDTELRSARGHLLGSMALGLEDTGARMSRIGYSQLVHGRVLDLNEIERRLESLTVEEVNEVGARWLSAQPTVACVGPSDSL